MSRAERRRNEKSLKQNTKAINSLTPAQARITDIVAEERGIIIANKYMENFEKLIDRSMSAALIEFDIDYSSIKNIQNNMSKMLIEDSEKSKQLEGEKINMAELEKNVLSAVKELLEKGSTKKEDIETLVYKFPKLSRSMLLNAYAKVKTEMGLVKDTVSKVDVDAYFMKNEIKLSGKQMVTGAMNKFSFTESTAKTYYSKWKKDYMADKTSVDPLIANKPPTIEKATPEELQENAVKIIETAKERQCKTVTEIKQAIGFTPNVKVVQAPVIINKVEVVEMKGLKVIEEKVIKTIKVQGENGVYAATTDKGLTLTKNDMTIGFENEEQLNEWITEVKQVFKMVM